MNRPAAMLQLCLLAAVAGVAGCSDGVARPLEILDSRLEGAAGLGPGGSSAPRAGAGGATTTAGRAGAGGSRSELQAGTGGQGDRPQDFCEPPMDAGSEMELTEALNAALENKSFCPDSRGPGPGLGRLTSTSDWRCMARGWAHTLATPERGGRSLPPVPPGWTLWDVDQQSYFWTRRQITETSDVKNALLFPDERRPDRRDELCEAAQLAAAQVPPMPYKYIGVGRYRDATVIFISPLPNSPFN